LRNEYSHEGSIRLYKHIREEIANKGSSKSKVVFNNTEKTNSAIPEINNPITTKDKASLEFIRVHETSLSVLRRRLTKLEPLKQIDMSNTKRMSGHLGELKCNKCIRMLEDINKNSSITFDIRDYVILL
jgi:hypothetical protein